MTESEDIKTWSRNLPKRRVFQAGDRVKTHFSTWFPNIVDAEYYFGTVISSAECTVQVTWDDGEKSACPKKKLSFLTEPEPELVHVMEEAPARSAASSSADVDPSDIIPDAETPDNDISIQESPPTVDVNSTIRITNIAKSDTKSKNRVLNKVIKLKVQKKKKMRLVKRKNESQEPSKDSDEATAKKEIRPTRKTRQPPKKRICLNKTPVKSGDPGTHAQSSEDVTESSEDEENESTPVIQADSRASDDPCSWTKKEVSFDMREQEHTHPYGIRFIPDSVILNDPAALFQAFLPTNYIDEEVLPQTNLRGRASNSGTRIWTDLTYEELLRFIGILVAMEVHYIPDRKEY